MRNSVISLLALTLCAGCTIAPHGSHSTHRIWTYKEGRPDGLLRYEVITDRSAGGGMSALTAAKATSATVSHTNALLQVGGSFVIGDGSISVDPQTSAIVGAIVKGVVEGVGKAAIP